MFRVEKLRSEVRGKQASCPICHPAQIPKAHCVILVIYPDSLDFWNVIPLGQNSHNPRTGRTAFRWDLTAVAGEGARSQLLIQTFQLFLLTSCTDCCMNQS